MHAKVPLVAAGGSHSRSVVPSGESWCRSELRSHSTLSCFQVTLTAPFPEPWHCRVTLHHSKVLARSWLRVRGLGTDSVPGTSDGSGREFAILPIPVFPMGHRPSVGSQDLAL